MNWKHRGRGIVKMAGAALLFVAPLTAQATCIEDQAAGICCKPAPCAQAEGFVNYETNRDVTGSLCGSDVLTLPFCEDTLTLKRLGLPTNAADPNHYSVWLTSDGPILGGVPFAASTALGDVSLKLTKFRYFITQDTAKNFLVQPPPVVLTQQWDCYGADNVKVTDPVTGDPIGRQPVGWVDQIGPHDATVSVPSLVCVPGNAVTTTTYVCFGTIRGFGQVPEKNRFPYLSVVPQADPATNGQLGKVEIKPPHEFCTRAL